MTEATLSPEFLARMDEAIAEEFERSSRLRKILPAEVDMPHARYGVVVPRVVDDPGSASASATTDVLRPPITLSREVKIAARQLEDLDLVLSLVRDATKRVCVVEDQVIAYGGLLAEFPPGLLQGVRIDGLRRQTEGLLGPGTRLIDVTPSSPATDPGEVLARAIENAAAELGLSGPPIHPPYSLALAPRAWRSYVPADEDEKDAIRAALLGGGLAAIHGPSPVLGLLRYFEGAVLQAVGIPPLAGISTLLQQASDVVVKRYKDQAQPHPDFLDTVLQDVSTAAQTAASAAASQPGATPQSVLSEFAKAVRAHTLTADAFFSLFSTDPIDLDLARVRAPWGSTRGHDARGDVRFVIESQLLLRVKRANATFAVWMVVDKPYQRLLGDLGT